MEERFQERTACILIEVSSFDVGYCLDNGFLGYYTLNGKNICSFTLKVEAASFSETSQQIYYP
jgi:hypothetical protein